jgi:3-phosphoinositide dependent protein kinase-1
MNDDESSSPRTSFVGTQDYVSPEVLSGDKRATKACDLWALGCMVYQMLSGVSPFRGGTEYLTFENIMGHCKGSQPLTFPAIIDIETQDLILKLLKTNDTERLGAGEDSSLNGYQILKTHPFFGPIEWGELEHKTPPFTPDASKFPLEEHMHDGASDEWLMEGEPTPIMSSRHSDLAVPVDLDEVDVAAPSINAKWERFLQAPERRVFTGLIFKRKVALFVFYTVTYITTKETINYLDV